MASFGVSSFVIVSPRLPPGGARPVPFLGARAAVKGRYAATQEARAGSRRSRNLFAPLSDRAGDFPVEADLPSEAGLARELVIRPR